MARLSLELHDEVLSFKIDPPVISQGDDQLPVDIDFDEIDEMWDGVDYPKLYCPKCGKPHFVPLDIWKKKNKYKKYFYN